MRDSRPEMNVSNMNAMWHFILAFSTAKYPAVKQRFSDEYTQKWGWLVT